MRERQRAAWLRLRKDSFTGAAYSRATRWRRGDAVDALLEGGRDSGHCSPEHPSPHARGLA